MLALTTFESDGALLRVDCILHDSLLMRAPDATARDAWLRALSAAADSDEHPALVPAIGRRIRLMNARQGLEHAAISATRRPRASGSASQSKVVKLHLGVLRYEPVEVLMRLGVPAHAERWGAVVIMLPTSSCGGTRRPSVRAHARVELARAS